MPNRILRDTILTSRKLAAVSCEAEVLYYRLMVAADDFGRFHADPSIVKGRCSPLRETDAKHVGKLLGELEKASLIILYEHAGERYLQFAKWGQKTRASESKFPDPPSDASICAQVLADDRSREQTQADVALDGDVFEDEDEDGDGLGTDVPRADVLELCERLATRIEGNTGRRPTFGSGPNGWLTSARLLIDKDGRPLEEARELIDWCQADEFWRSNILSMPKFRQKYDTLRLQAKRKSNGNGTLSRLAAIARGEL